MPVIAHDIHASTVKTGTEPYGCSNREMRDKYLAPDRIYTDAGIYVDTSAWVDHTMSRECRHDNSLNDPGCAECKHRGSGERYSEIVRKEGR